MCARIQTARAHQEALLSYLKESHTRATSLPSSLDALPKSDAADDLDLIQSSVQAAAASASGTPASASASSSSSSTPVPHAMLESSLSMEASQPPQPQHQLTAAANRPRREVRPPAHSAAAANAANAASAGANSAIDADEAAAMNAAAANALARYHTSYIFTLYHQINHDCCP
jgi:hypothetical protein